jgi:spore germination protein KB
MIAGREKISANQLMLLFIMCTYSLTAKEAGPAAWLSPVIPAFCLLILVVIVQSFFKKNNNMNLTDVYMKILGKLPGYLILFVYLFAILVLLALYTRYYAERITSSIFPDTSISFFIIVMLALVYYIVRGGLAALARFNELVFIVFIVLLGLGIFLSLFNVEITHLLPISTLDIIPVVRTSPVILAIWTYFLFVFFFADKVNDKEHIMRLGIKTTVFITISSMIIIITTVGTLGSSLAERVSLPYILTVKEISILDTLERLESITLSLWVAADCIIISVFTYIILSILKTLFRLSSTKALAGPVLLITYVLSMVLARNRFELEAFSNKIFIPFNVLLGFVVPVIVFIVGKIRNIDKKSARQP